jgi:hypothetical protein
MLYRSQTLCVLSVCVLWACGADGGVPSGAEVEIDGGGSAYEPERDAGPVNAGSPAVAGRTLAVTGGTAGGAGGTVSTPTPAPTKPADPSPRWVLRNSTGAAVQADVSPGYAVEVSRFANVSATSVYVRYAGQRRLDLTYSLATGAVVPDSDCSASDWRSLPAKCAVAYADASCSQPLGAAQRVYVIAGKAHYTDMTPSTADTVYYWSGTACVATSGGSWYPLTEVPSEIAGLLPSAPYSLELVY